MQQEISTNQVKQILAFNFEVYTCNPITGEEGWDIKFPSIFAETKKDAIQILKTEYPNFDCVILFNYGEVELSELDWAVVSMGKKWRDTTYQDRYN